MKFASIIAAALLFAAPALAQNGEGLNLPPEGQTIINFSASERVTLPQDLLIASLRIEAEDKEPKPIQMKINEAMKKALDLAKAHGTLKVSTGSYSVYKYDRPIEINPKTGEQKTQIEWRGSQTITIESKDSETLLDVVGKIQALGFAMNDLSYTLSPEAIEKARDELMVSALKKLLEKGQIVATTLGKSKVDLVDVNVDMSGPIMPMYKTMMARAEMAVAADASMPAPVAEAGEQDVTMSVSARALIKP
jgi:predicted secreted protein